MIQARQAAGLSQIELAGRLAGQDIAITRGMVSRLERGEAVAGACERDDLLRAIATVTGTDPRWIIFDGSAVHPPGQVDGAGDHPEAGAWRPGIGERVRVRGHIGPQTACDECPHANEEEGRTGKVIAELPAPGAPDHPYLIVYDRPLACEMRPARYVELRVSL